MSPPPPTDLSLMHWWLGRAGHGEKQLHYGSSLGGLLAALHLAEWPLWP